LSEDTRLYYSASAVALRWVCSEKNATRILEQYRGRDGFLDLDQRGNRYRRNHSIIRIHRSLLIQIEREREVSNVRSF
jgi:hypothetical protein